MNTRLQVEHPVTEAVTGLDLVEWQLRVAAGEALPLTQSEIALDGHAIEARLYAEDPANGFLPSVGPLTVFSLPDGVRTDSSVEAGDAASPHYDPMLAKLISHAATREEAAARLALACANVCVWPVKTNAWFLARCLQEDAFLHGEADTGFVEAHLPSLAQPPKPSDRAAAAVAAAFTFDAAAPGGSADPWSTFGLRVNGPPSAFIRLHRDGVKIDAFVSRVAGDLSVEIGEARFGVRREQDDRVTADGVAFVVVATGEGKVVFESGGAYAFQLYRSGDTEDPSGGDGAIRSPMPGRIVSIARRAGEAVKANETLVTLEAMKMEHALKAPFDGTVAEINVNEGDQVSEGVVLVRLAALA